MSSLVADPRAGWPGAPGSGVRAETRSRGGSRNWAGRSPGPIPDGELLLIGLLKGSFIFLADLVRAIERPLQVDFLVASSYGAGTVSSGEVRLLYEPAAALAGRHILLVEDIIDSGRTLASLVDRLRSRGPRSLAICALLDKRIAPPLPELRFVGFTAPPAFLVGYGLDHAEDFRHLPYIAELG